jgi:hypothetical protein
MNTTTAKKKGPSLLETVASLRMRIRHLLWTFVWALVTITATAVIVIFLVSRGNGNEEMTQALSYEQKLTRNTLVAEGMATRDVVSNAVTELKGVLKKASEENVAAQVASANSVNKTLETEGLKNEMTLTKLQNATVDGLTGVIAQVKENGEASKANADKLEAMLAETAKKNADIARLEAELATLKVNPVRPAEAPVMSESFQTEKLSFGQVSGSAPRAQARSLEKSPSITDENWKRVPAGSVYYCSPSDILSKRVEINDSTGIIAMSFRGWLPRKFLGQYPVVDKTVTITRGATSVGLMKPDGEFSVRVNK